MLSTERPISEVLKNIFGDLQDIVRSEVKLGKTELKEDLAKTQHAAVWLAAGALVGIFAVLFILLAIFFGLSYVVPEWAAAGLIALALGGSCVIAVNVAAAEFKKLKQVRASPSVTQIKENIEWAKQQVK